MKSRDHINLTEAYSAHNYHPLEVVISQGTGAWVRDLEGKRYLDMLSAYSAVTWGHSNPRFVEVAIKQLQRLTLTSRAFYNDQLGLFCRDLADLCHMDLVLPMNTGTEAVESAIKAARKWAYEVKNIEKNKAEIIAFEGNFHGRTTTIISFSCSFNSREGFGPFTPGFKLVPYGDIEAVKNAITPNTAAVLVEPIQGEGGVIIPPTGFIKQLRELCTAENVLMLADEIQTGLCRTGKIFACDHESVKPDMYILGKALGAGIVPISAIVSSHHVLKVLTPGTHGSTFGGNPFACAIARDVISYIKGERPERKAQELGGFMLEKLKLIESPKIKEIRGRGLLIGMELTLEAGKARGYCEKLKNLGILCKDTQEQTIRFAPPVVIEKAEIEWAVEKIGAALAAVA